MIDKDWGNVFKDGFIIWREVVEYGILLFIFLDIVDVIVWVMEFCVFLINFI